MTEQEMGNYEFDLGEALGGYEQAQTDRNFYLSLVQGGTTAASPIAAYLAGVSGVKMANMRAKSQDIQDKRQSEKDAIAATERVQKRAANLDNQIIGIITGVRNGTLAPGAGAAMLGPVMKERGFVLKNYDADNNTMTYGMPGDPNDYEFDLNEHESMKESGLNKRQAKRLAAQSALQDKRTQGQIKVAKEKAALKGSSGSGKKTDPWTTFSSTQKDMINFLNMPQITDADLVNIVDRGAALRFVQAAEALPEERKKTLGPQINRLKYLYKIKPEETKEEVIDFDSMWEE